MALVQVEADDDVEHQDVYMGTSRALLDNFEGIGGHTQAQPLKQPPPSAPSCISMLYDGHSVPGMLA